MNKGQLKKLLKPLVKECIKEALLEEGILSGIISEVAVGLSQGAILGESARAVSPRAQERQPAVDLEERRRLMEDERQERISRLNESFGNKFGGIDIFEGTTPVDAGPAPGAHSAPGALAGVDPNDAGVDISALQSIVGNHWNKLR